MLAAAAFVISAIQAGKTLSTPVVLYSYADVVEAFEPPTPAVGVVVMTINIVLAVSGEKTLRATDRVP